MKRLGGVAEVGTLVARFGGSGNGSGGDVKRRGLRGLVGVMGGRDVDPLGAGHGTSRGRKKPISGDSGFLECVSISIHYFSSGIKLASGSCL